jgi:hypothetical protein
MVYSRSLRGTIIETAWSVIKMIGKVTPLKGDRSESMKRLKRKNLPLLDRNGRGRNKKKAKNPQLISAKYSSVNPGIW